MQILEGYAEFESFCLHCVGLWICRRGGPLPWIRHWIYQALLQRKDSNRFPRIRPITKKWYSLLASFPFRVTNAASCKRPCGKAARKEEIENCPFLLYTVNSLTPFSFNKIIKLPKYSIFGRSSRVHFIHLDEISFHWSYASAACRSRYFVWHLLCLNVKRGHQTSDFRTSDIERRSRTGNPGFTIVPQYESYKVTMFVWGKATILRFVGNTK